MSRILHILSQIPSKTGSGIFLDNILFQGQLAGHEQGLVLGLPSSYPYQPPRYVTCYRAVFFETDALPYKIPGMSDVMPYASTKFSDLTPEEWQAYLKVFDEAIATAIATFNPDVILSNHLWAVTALAARIAHQNAIGQSIKVYGVSHGTDLRQMVLAPYLKDFILENCQQLEGVFCLHEEQVQRISDLYGIDRKRLYLSGNGYNAHVFKRFNRKPKDTLNLVYAGKLSFSKGVLELIEGVNALNERLKTKSLNSTGGPLPFLVTLSLAGKGSGLEEEVILKAAAESPYTQCLGFLDQKQLAETFYQSDLFVLPSYYEGLPLVVLEALATGLPVVVTELAGLKAWLGEEINQSGYISYVQLPELEGFDQCKKAAREPFIKALTAALEIQVDKIISQGYTADFPYGAIEAHAWEVVFKRIALEMGL